MLNVAGIHRCASWNGGEAVSKGRLRKSRELSRRSGTARNLRLLKWRPSQENGTPTYEFAVPCSFAASFCEWLFAASAKYGFWFALPNPRWQTASGARQPSIGNPTGSPRRARRRPAGRRCAGHGNELPTTDVLPGSKLAAVRIAQPAEFGLCSLNERIFPTARAAFGVRLPSYGGSAADIRA